MTAPLNVHVVYSKTCSSCHRMFASGVLGEARAKFGDRLRWWFHEGAAPATQKWLKESGLAKEFKGYPSIYVCGADHCVLTQLGTPDREDFLHVLGEMVEAHGGGA